MRHFILTIALSFMAYVPYAQALDINQFDLFRNGFYIEVSNWQDHPNGWVVNDHDQYILHDQDMTGIGFRNDDITKAAVLVTKKHVLMTGEPSAYDDNQALVFVTSTGETMLMRTQEVIAQIDLNGNGWPASTSPLLLIELDQEVPDSITPVKVDVIRPRDEMVNTEVILYGTRTESGNDYILPVVAHNEINQDFNPDFAYLGMKYTEPTIHMPDSVGIREEQDKGSPSLKLDTNDDLHKLIGLDTGLGFDVYVPFYREQMEMALNARGYSLDPQSCLADLNQDGKMDNSDIQLFIAAFENQDQLADLAEPHGIFDFNDIREFILLFQSCSADLNNDE